MNLTRRLVLKLTALLFWRASSAQVIGSESNDSRPFGDAYPQLDSLATGEWWLAKRPATKNPAQPISMDVARDQVVAFALYTHDHGVLKLTSQFYPLKPDEEHKARLELQRNGIWTEVAAEPILYPGWSSHFRIENWDATLDVPYRVRHGD